MTHLDFNIIVTLLNQYLKEKRDSIEGRITNAISEYSGFYKRDPGNAFYENLYLELIEEANATKRILVGDTKTQMPIWADTLAQRFETYLRNLGEDPETEDYLIYNYEKDIENGFKLNSFGLSLPQFKLFFNLEFFIRYAINRVLYSKYINLEIGYKKLEKEPFRIFPQEPLFPNPLEALLTDGELYSSFIKPEKTEKIERYESSIGFSYRQASIIIYYNQIDFHNGSREETAELFGFNKKQSVTLLSKYKSEFLTQRRNLDLTKKGLHSLEKDYLFCKRFIKQDCDAKFFEDLERVMKEIECST